MSNNNYYWTDYAGNRNVIQAPQGNVLSYTDPLVQAQKINSTLPNGTTFKSALNRSGGIGFGDYKFFQDVDLNFTPAQLEDLNIKTNGEFSTLDKAQQIQLVQSGQLDKLLGVQTHGQAQQAWGAIKNSMNNNQWTTKDTFNAIGTGIQALTSLYGIYNAHQQLGLAKKAFAEQSALNRANFRNQARTLNSQYRDQASGRGHVGMNSQARSSLGRTYQERKVDETY